MVSGEECVLLYLLRQKELDGESVTNVFVHTDRISRSFVKAVVVLTRSEPKTEGVHFPRNTQNARTKTDLAG